MEYYSVSKTPLSTGTYLRTMEDSALKISDIPDDITPYQQLVGCILHFSNTTRPDISYTAGYISRFMQNHTNQQWKVAKNVLLYFKGTKEAGVTYRRSKDCEYLKLLEYSDAD